MFGSSSRKDLQIEMEEILSTYEELMSNKMLTKGKVDAAISLQDDIYEILKIKGLNVINDVFHTLMKLILSLGKDEDSKVMMILQFVLKLAKENPDAYYNYFVQSWDGYSTQEMVKPSRLIHLLIFSYKQLENRDCVEISRSIPARVGKFLQKHRDLDSCLAIISLLDENFDVMDVTRSSRSLCRGIMMAVCNPSFNTKSFINFRGGARKIVSFLMKMFEKSDNNMEEFCIDEIIYELFHNSFVKCQTRRHDPALSILVGGVVQHFNSHLVCDTLEAYMANFKLIFNKISKDSKGNDNVSEEEVMVNIGSSLFHWLNWPHVENIGILILTCCRSLVTSKKLVPLMNLLLKELDKLFLLMKLPITRKAALDIYVDLQLSFRKNPVIFNRHTKDLVELIRYLKAVEGDDRESCNEAAQKLMEMLQCLCNLHYPRSDASNILSNLVQCERTLSDDDVENLLKEHVSIFDTQPFRQYFSSNEKVVRNGACGLTNMGSTCYINCVIQSLFACTKFSKEVLEISDKSAVFTCSLQITFANLILSKRNFFSPKEVVDSCIPLFFPPDHQQDCSEFLTRFLDNMSEELLQNGESVVTKNFSGHMTNILKCCECQSQSIKNEHFFSLPVVVPPDNTTQDSKIYDLPELLTNHFKHEVLVDSNKYFCDKCKKLVEAEKHQLIESSPRYLVIVLLRFLYDQQSHVRRKISTRVNCSEYINLPVAVNKCRREEGENSDSCEETRASYEVAETENIRYKLRSISVHSGMSLEAGHYYCFASLPRHPRKDSDGKEESSSSDHWYLLDDVEARPIAFDALARCTSGSFVHTPYVLFYSREDGGEPNNISGEDIPINLRVKVEEDNKIFEKAQKIKKSFGQFGKVGIEYNNNTDDDDDDNFPRSRRNNFCEGPRLIY